MVLAKKRQSGFTLLELMTVVAMLMILAAIAIPSYTGYVRRSKSSEVASNLNSVFKNAATYYSMERSAAGIGTTGLAGACTVGQADPEPNPPGMQKQKFAPASDSGFTALGFTISDLVYYSYGIVSAGAQCGNNPVSSLYTFYANGDLDEDGTLSTFEMGVASDVQNLLYHGVGFYVNNESE